MRKIKFRGKTACCQLATAEDVWVYGGVHSIFENDDTCYISVNNYFEKNRAEKLLVKKNTIGQYTGLKDKNGKEIYEGDILRFSDVDTAVVEWNEKYTYFMVKPIQDYYFDSDVLGQAIEYIKVEIIGNIYENADLLKD